MGRLLQCGRTTRLVSAGLVVATALLAVKFVRKGNDCVAAGFLVFVAGESLLLSGAAVGLADSVPSFGGVALWSASLLAINMVCTLIVIAEQLQPLICVTG